ncbi:SH3 domain-containing protein [Chloroflexi bacterium TSY]|nr:SH3 domain-containing protein [Chloroflexi bacterium TSY]
MSLLHDLPKLRFSIALYMVPLLIISGCAGFSWLDESTLVQTSVSGTSTPVPSLTPTPTIAPTPEPTPTPAAYAVLRTRGGNLRSGPGMNFPVVLVIKQGDIYPIVGRSENRSWWQLCCVPNPDDTTGETQIPVWVAASIVDVEGDAAQITGQMEQVDRPEPLFADDFTAQWTISYRCDSQRCEVAECGGEVLVQVRSILQNTWLELDHSVTWPDECGDDTVALYQINRYTGQDRYVGEDAAFFDRYWMGANFVKADKTISLPDGLAVQAWCTEPQSLELEANENWIVVHDGEACYDVDTGMMIQLSYSKRWLFTGVVEGQNFERAFFGDTEYYNFDLHFTNAPLGDTN